MGKLVGLLLVLGLGSCGAQQAIQHHRSGTGWTGYVPLHGKAAAAQMEKCMRHPMPARKLQRCIAKADVLSRAAAVTPGGVIRRVVTPFTASGYLRPNLRVTDVRAGDPECMPTSDVLPNNVYRCSAGRYIYDPCWRDWRSLTPAVVCLVEPWGRTAVRLLLGKAPIRSYGHDDYSVEPWGITLASGARCLAFQGAHDSAEIKGRMVVVDYYCGGPQGTLFLLRGIHRGATWKIRAARLVHRYPYRYLGWVAVKTAWYGGNDPLSRRP